MYVLKKKSEEKEKKKWCVDEVGGGGNIPEPRRPLWALHLSVFVLQTPAHPLLFMFPHPVFSFTQSVFGIKENGVKQKRRRTQNTTVFDVIQPVENNKNHFDEPNCTCHPYMYIWWRFYTGKHHKKTNI